MKHASPVFIVGNPRSGTSLLYRIVQQLSSFRPRTMELSETQIFLHLALSYRFETKPPGQLLRFMLKDKAHFEAFLEETRLLRRGALLSAPLALPSRGNLPLVLWRAQGLHLVVRSYLWHAWQARECDRLVEKSPRNLPHVDKLRLVSPSARFIYIGRHPVDCFSSYRKRAQVDAKAQWASVSPARFLYIYRRAVVRALKQSSASPASFLLIRYEDLTADAVSEMRRICVFIGEPYEESALQAVQPPERRRHSAYKHLYGEVQSRTKRWQDFVGIDEARGIEDELSDLMPALGYERYT